MPEGTSVGNVYLDLVVRDTMARQLQEIADRARSAAQKQFSDMGKSLGDAMGKTMTQGMENASRNLSQTVNGSFSKSAELLKAKMRSLQRQIEENREKMRQLAAATLEWANTKVKPQWADQAAASALRANKSFQVLQRQQEKLNEQMEYLREKLAIEVQAQAQKQAAAEQAAYAKTAKAAESAAKRQQEAARQAHTTTAPPEKTELSKEMKPLNSQISRASSGVQSLGVRLKSVVAGALVFNLISAGLRKMVGWLGNALQSSNSFRQALANLQAAASMAAAPLVDALGGALTYVINMLATGVSYLAQFISMLTGKSLSAMKNSAKAMNSYGSAAGSAAKETKKANGELAAFDELNVLNKQQNDDAGGSGGGGGGAIAPNYGFVDKTGAGFAALMDRMKAFWDAFTTALAPSIAAWSAAWEQIKATALSVWPQIQAAALGLWTNALQPLLGYLAGTFAPGVINAFSQTFAPIVGGTVSAAIRILADTFVWMCGILTDAINNLIRPALEVLLTVWQDMMNGISNTWTTYGQPVMDGLVLAFQNLQTIFSTLYYTVEEPILANIIALLDQLWSQHAKPLWDDLLLLIASVQNMLLTFWNNVLAPLINWLIATFGPTFADVFNAVAGYVMNAMGLVADVIDIAMVLLRGLCDFLTAVFKGDWDAAWNAIADTALAVWERIQNGIKSYINGIIGFVNNMIQAIVAGINGIADAMNNLSVDVPDWVPGLGGSHIGFSFDHVTAPQIPMLASGGIIEQPTLAMMGEYTGAGHNPEIAAPQSLLAETVNESIAPLVSALAELIQYLRDGGNQEIVIRFAASGGLEQLVRLLKPYIDKENNRRGGKLITGGVY